MSERGVIKWSDLAGQLMKSSFDGNKPALPFGEDILLAEMALAGLQFYEANEAWNSISEGALLTLKRNPNNKYDSMAIEVWSGDGHQLGHIPSKENKILARLMDAGKALKAEVQSKDEHFDVWGIKITVSMVNL